MHKTYTAPKATLTLILALILCTTIASQSHALRIAEGNNLMPIYGLAMHESPGLSPKYNSTDTHLDYANPDAPKGGTLKQAAVGTFDTINPYTLKGTVAKGVNLTHDRLMRRVWDEPFTLYPQIAEHINISPDRSSISFQVHRKAQFSDGTHITAEDVIFSFETLRDHGRPNMQRIYKLVSEVKKLSDMTVLFTFGEGYDQETALILAMMPVLSKAYWSGREFDTTTLDIPVTSGPYTIESIDPGRKIVYKRNPEYWAKDLLVSKGHYNLDNIEYIYFRDETVALEAFKSGDLNLRREPNAAKWTSAYSDAPDNITQHNIKHDRPERVKSLIFNTRRPPFDDIRVRKAINLAFDFEWMNKSLLHGQYKRIQSYYPNASLAANDPITREEIDLFTSYGTVDDSQDSSLSLPDIQTLWSPSITPDNRAHRKNLRKAAALLQDAGWIIQDGVRVKADDPAQELSFEIVISESEDEKIVLAYGRALERLGIKASIRLLDIATFQGRLRTFDYDMVLYFWRNSLSPGTEQALFFSCNAATTEGQWNYAGACDPTLDKLIYGIAGAKTRLELINHAKLIDRILLNGVYTVPLYYAGKDFIALNNDFHYPKNIPLYGIVMETLWYAAETGAE